MSLNSNTSVVSTDGPPEKWTMKRMSYEHHQLVEYAVRGFTPQQIAQLTGRSVEGIRLLIAQPMFQDELARRRGQVSKQTDQAEITNLVKSKQMFDDVLVEATEKQIGLMRDGDKDVSQKALDRIWDMAYGKNGKGSDQNNGPTIVLESGAMLALQVALREDSGLSLVMHGQAGAVGTVPTEVSGNASVNHMHSSLTGESELDSQGPSSGQATAPELELSSSKGCG